jgi:hypothetical protein
VCIGWESMADPTPGSENRRAICTSCVCSYRCDFMICTLAVAPCAHA